MARGLKRLLQPDVLIPVILIVGAVAVDFGVTELSGGVGAFLVAGVEKNAAISAMFINRVLTLGFSVVIGLIVSLVLRDELRKALRARGAKRTGRLGLVASSGEGERKDKDEHRDDADEDPARDDPVRAAG